MASVVRSLHRVYEGFDAQCVKVAVPMEILVGRIPVKILLLLMASALAVVGWVVDVVPNPYTACCYVLVVLAVIAALIVQKIEKIIYRGQE